MEGEGAEQALADVLPAGLDVHEHQDPVPVVHGHQPQILEVGAPKLRHDGNDRGLERVRAGRRVLPVSEEAVRPLDVRECWIMASRSP
jgi:hypothetical protein